MFYKLKCKYDKSHPNFVHTSHVSLPAFIKKFRGTSQKFSMTSINCLKQIKTLLILKNVINRGSNNIIYFNEIKINSNLLIDSCCRVFFFIRNIKCIHTYTHTKHQVKFIEMPLSDDLKSKMTSTLLLACVVVNIFFIIFILRR